MSESNDQFETKPIVNVMNDLHSINQKMNQMKVDIIYIKSDLKLILEQLQEREKIEKMGGGWWIY